MERVRLSKIKRHFEKGYTPNWTEEIFIVDGIHHTTPITYTIKDLNNEKIFIIERESKKGLGSAYVEGFSWSLKNNYQKINTKI